MQPHSRYDPPPRTKTNLGYVFSVADGSDRKPRYIDFYYMEKRKTDETTYAYTSRANEIEGENEGEKK
jgi:hypothetical protein